MSSNDKDAEVFESLFNFYSTWSNLSNQISINEHINMNVCLLRKQATENQRSFCRQWIFISVKAL